MKKITIVQLNDVHAYLNLHEEAFYGKEHLEYRKCGGYARISSLLKDIRKNSKNTLLFDCGDTLHGTFSVVDTKAEFMPDILNDLGMDAMTGHWEFAYGPKRLKEITNRLNYPFLAANIYDKKTKKLVYPPTTILEKEGIRIGVIGLACNIIDKTMPSSFSEGIFFTNGTEELPQQIDLLKNVENVDLVILLTHNGFPQDVALIEQNKGIDICLSSHTHNRLYKPFVVNNTIIMQSGSHGSFLGKLELHIKDNKIENYIHELIEVSEDISADSDMQEKIDKHLKPYKYLEEIVGKTEVSLNRSLSLECTMDDLLLKSMKESVSAAICFSNGWRYGAPVPAGDITLNDLYNIVPMDPFISKVDLKGFEILQLLEDDLDKTYNNSPLEQMGGYVKRTLNMKVYVRVENPKNSRVQFAFINGQKLNPDTTYKAAFITSQGVPKKFGTNRAKTEIHIVAAMKNYLKKQSPLEFNLEDTFVLI